MAALKGSGAELNHYKRLFYREDKGFTVVQLRSKTAFLF